MSIGLGEILITLLVGFIVVGPEDLPKVARTVARWVRKIRQMMKELSKNVEAEIKLDEDIREVKEELKDVSSEFERVQREVVLHAEEGTKVVEINCESK